MADPIRIKRPTVLPAHTIPPPTGCWCCSCTLTEVDEFCREHGDAVSYRSCETHRAVGRIHHIRSDVGGMLSVQQKRQGNANP